MAETQPKSINKLAFVPLILFVALAGVFAFQLTAGKDTSELPSALIGKAAPATDLPPLDPAQDRAMICGSPGLLKDTCTLLNERGFSISPHIGEPGHYVIERAFVEK